MPPPRVEDLKPQIEALVESATWAFCAGLFDVDELERLVEEELNRLVIGHMIRQWFMAPRLG